MGALVACLLGFYTIAKVLRDSMFMSQYGALALPYGYIAVAFFSLGYIWLEPLITRRFTRASADAFSQLVAIGCSVAAALLFPLEKHWLAGAFYVWTGSQAMMLLSASGCWRSTCGILGGRACCSRCSPAPACSAAWPAAHSRVGCSRGSVSVDCSGPWLDSSSWPA
jgi:hypothetical protein